MPFNISIPVSKILVVSGTPWTNTSDLISLDSSQTQCSVEDFPLELYGTVGFTSAQGPVVCGGKELLFDTSYNKQCFVLKANQWKPWSQMTTSRAEASSIQINATHTLILGGYKENVIHLNSSEIVNANGATRSIDFPVTITLHCILKYNETMGVITGGSQNRSLSPAKSYLLNLDTLDITSGPRLQIARGSHGCGSFKLGSKTYGIIGGGNGYDGYIDSTEILDLEQVNPKWTDGKQKYFSALTFVSFFGLQDQSYQED